jgi:Fe-S-cluster-containing hydrogenase component 2
MCPTQALDVAETDNGFFVPALNADKCIQCGLCLRVCPAANENFSSLNEFVFGRVPENKTDRLMGGHLNCYTGY